MSRVIGYVAFSKIIFERSLEGIIFTIRLFSLILFSCFWSRILLSMVLFKMNFSLTNQNLVMVHGILITIIIWAGFFCYQKCPCCQEVRQSNDGWNDLWFVFLNEVSSSLGREFVFFFSVSFAFSALIK